MKEDSFIGSVFGNLTVVGIAGKNKQGHKEYSCHCSECAKDPELHGTAIYKCTKFNLVNNGQIPCGCAKNPRWTASQYRTLISRKAAGKFSVVVPDNAKNGTRVSCKCAVDGCGHEWETSISCLLCQGTGCPKCAGKAPVTENEAVSVITKICSEKGWTFLGFKTTWKNCYSKLLLECHCGHKWDASYTSIVHMDSGCKKCAGKLPITEDIAISKIQAICSEKGWTFLGFKNDWSGAYSKLILECHCGRKWSPSYNNIVNNDIGCSECAKTGYNPGLPGWIYCHIWTNPEGHQFLKYGITNYPKQRINQQKSKTQYIPKQLFSLSFEDGSIPKRLEDAISEFTKANTIPHQVSREDFRDGWTETLPLFAYNFIRDLIFQTTMCRLQPITL